MAYGDDANSFAVVPSAAVINGGAAGTGLACVLICADYVVRLLESRKMPGIDAGTIYILLAGQPAGVPNFVDASAMVYKFQICANIFRVYDKRERRKPRHIALMQHPNFLNAGSTSSWNVIVRAQAFR